MRPLSDYILLFAVSCLTLGCATTGDKQTAVRPMWKSPAAFAKEQAATKKQEAEKAELAAKSKNPFQADKPATPAATESKGTEIQAAAKTTKDTKEKETASKDESPVAAATPAAKTDTPPKPAEKKTAGVFGPETLRLIDAELNDATPEERAFWYDQLKKVDPAMIPQILQARRLTSQVAEQQKKMAAVDEHQASIRQPAGDRGGNPASEIVNADVRQIPGEAPEVQSAHYETDGRDAMPAIVQQQYEAPAAPPGKRPFVVTKKPDPGALPTPPPVSPATPATGSATRNPLTKFLPMGQSGTITQTAANSPSGVSLLPPRGIESQDSQARLDELISQVEAEVTQLVPGTNEAAQTDYIQRHVYLRLLYLMADHPERALTAIPGIEPADQEFWQQVLWAMANYFDSEHLPTAKDRAGQAIAQLTTATQRLREKADLEVRNMAFCRDITYFGNFVRFPRDEFRPGDKVLLYAEIENFKSEMTIDGQFRTLIRSTLEILSPSGEVRWQKEFEAKEDLCINYRRDYFHNYEFAIPDRLPLGPHQLKLTVFDELSGKMVSQSINFVVR